MMRTDWKDAQKITFVGEPPARQQRNRLASRGSKASMETRMIRALRGTAKGVAWAGGGVIALFLCTRALHWASALMVATVVSSMAFGQQASMPVLPTANRPDAAILKVAETYRRAVVDADAGAVMALYRDDAVEIPYFQPPVVGKAAIEHFYEGMFRGPVKVTEFTLVPSEATIREDVAYNVGSYTRTMTGAPGGPIHAVGTYVVILKRTGDQWRIAYATYTCDCPKANEGASAMSQHASSR